MRIIARFSILIMALVIIFDTSKDKALRWPKEQSIYLTDYSNDLEGAIDASVLIHVKSNDNSERKVGAGVLWQNDGDTCYILTCAHLFSDIKNSSVRVFPFGNKYMMQGKNASLVGVSNTFDIALLKCTWKNPRLVTSASAKDIKVAMPIFAFGNPNGKGASVSAGIVSIPYEKLNEQFMHRIDCTLLPGNSGGGIFNNRGEMVGLVVSKVATDNATECYGYAIPYPIADAIGKSILSFEANQAPLLPQFDFSYRVIYQYESNRDAWKEEIVIEKASSSLALSVGDRVKTITVNQKSYSITSEEQFSSLLLSAITQSTIFLTVTHYGEERIVEIPVGARILQ